MAVSPFQYCYDIRKYLVGSEIGVALNHNVNDAGRVVRTFFQYPSSLVDHGLKDVSDFIAVSHCFKRDIVASYSLNLQTI